MLKIVVSYETFDGEVGTKICNNHTQADRFLLRNVATIVSSRMFFFKDKEVTFNIAYPLSVQKTSLRRHPEQFPVN